MSRFDYSKYRASREWALLKRKIMARACGPGMDAAICERCFKDYARQVHHLTYERIGHERLTDLAALCASCHEFLSAVTDIDPLGKPDFNHAAEKLFDHYVKHDDVDGMMWLGRQLTAKLGWCVQVAFPRNPELEKIFLDYARAAYRTYP